MRGDEGEEVRMHEQAGIEFAPAPCPRCGATNEDQAGSMCRPTSDQTGERACPGEFNEQGISVQATPESIAAMDRWIEEQVAKDNESGDPMAGYLDGFRAGIEAAARLVDRDGSQTPAGEIADAINDTREVLAQRVREFGAKVAEGLDAMDPDSSRTPEES